MKVLLIIILAIATQTNAFASMTPTEELKYVKQVAKEIRRDLWIAGHEDVDSSEGKMTKSELDNYVKQEINSRYETPLDSEEISELYRCHYTSHCSLYIISANSSYYSGYGIENHFVLLNTDEAKHVAISHVVYAE